MKKLIAAVLVLPAVASAYQYDVSVASISQDMSTVGKADTMGLEANYLFEPVEFKDHPFAEAAFLEKVGSAGVVYATGTFKPKGGGASADISVTRLQAELMNADLPVTANISAESTRAAFPASLTEMYKVTFEPGAWVGDTLVDLHFAHEGTNSNAGSKTSNVELGLAAKYATNQYTVAGGMMKVDSTTTGGKELQNKEFNLGGNYYVSQRIGLGLEYTTNAGEDKTAEGATMGLNAVFYFNEQYSAELQYSSFSADNVVGSDEKDMTIAVNGKF